MNFLAHIYLSGNNNEILIGNFIGDYVKGNKHSHYPELIQRGILLHRKIDSFTDSHPLVKNSSSYLRPYYKKYSGVVVDLFYDHFLAANWNKYCELSLNSFVSKVHKLLIRNYFKLPGEVKSFLPFLVKNRRLENYRNVEGIERSLTIMTQYTSMPAHVNDAMMVLNICYSELQHDFELFFEDVQAMVAQELNGDMVIKP